MRSLRFIAQVYLDIPSLCVAFDMAQFSTVCSDQEFYGGTDFERPSIVELRRLM